MNFKRHDMDSGGHGSMSGDSSHDDMSHGSSDDSASMSMSMADMVMTFFTSSKTPLFSDDWSPDNDGQYAGTCIFLILLGISLRVLLALRPILETRLWRKPAVAVKASLKASDASDEEKIFLDGRSAQALTVVRNDVQRGWSGWRVGAAASRATFEMTIAGVAYLLMIAVMTMNVGYFLSVLGGIWIGTFMLGELSYDNSYSHC